MRIEAAGGFVLRKRVMGVLAVARSFGDFVLKPVRGRRHGGVGKLVCRPWPPSPLPAPCQFVPADPYTSTTKLDAMVRECNGGGGVAPPSSS